MRRMLASLALAMAAGCGGGGGPQGGAAPPASAGLAEAEKTYPLSGEVRKVEVEQGRVVLRHDEIPGYMPKMTMPFRLADKDALESLVVGDKVSATLKVKGDRSELADLTVTEAAAPRAVSLDPSGGQAKIDQPPKKLEPGEEVPDFAMTTQEGTPLKLSDLRGKVVVLTFIYTRCPLPDFCPKMDERFAELVRMIGAVPGRAEGVRLLSVSFDPEHDTPEVLARHAKMRGAKPPLWRFVVASHEELGKVARQLGLSYGPARDEVIHSLTTAVIGRDGRLVRLLEGSSWTPGDVFATVGRALARDPKAP